MNSVPRLDSPKTMPLRSPLDDRRAYNQRMLTNGVANPVPLQPSLSTSLQTVRATLPPHSQRPSILFPGTSPSMGPEPADPLADMEDLRPIDLTGSNASIDLNGSTASLDLAAPGNRESRPAEPASPMPPLDLGEPFIRSRAGEGLSRRRGRHAGAGHLEADAAGARRLARQLGGGGCGRLPAGRGDAGGGGRCDG